MFLEKKYSVFISSTFEDLKSERSNIQDTIISSGDFPVQMETFPAADQDQFEFIKGLISNCDYYILIIGRKYGSISNTGESYTHLEYKYAKEIGLPILALILDSTIDVAASKSEEDPEKRAKLSDFIEEVKKGRIVKF